MVSNKQANNSFIFDDIYRYWLCKDINDLTISPPSKGNPI